MLSSTTPSIVTLILPIHNINQQLHVDVSDVIRQAEKIDENSHTIIIEISNEGNKHFNQTTFATHVYNALIDAGKPRLNLIINRYNHHHECHVHPTTRNENWKLLDSPETELKQYEKVAVGGTFDRLHAGHRLLLTTAVWSASKTLCVGMTCDTLLKHKQHHVVIQDMKSRSDNVVAFVKSINPLLNVQISILTNKAGASGTDPLMNALVVSKETLKSAHEINEQRLKLKLKQFAIISVDVLNNPNSINKLSSTVLRNQDLHHHHHHHHCPSSSLPN